MITETSVIGYSTWNDSATTLLLAKAFFLPLFFSGVIVQRPAGKEQISLSMRIIHVANVRWFNATAWYALKLAKLQKDSEHEVLVLTLEGTETHQKAMDMGLCPRSMDLNTTNPLTLLRVWSELNKLVNDFSPDIVNCHRGEGYVFWGLLRRFQGTFKLIRTRGDQRLPKNSLINRILHHRLTDAVVATNSRMAQHFVNKMELPLEKIITILGGVDRTVFQFQAEGRADVRKEFGYSKNEQVVGVLGRFDRVKGHLEVIQAASLLKNKGCTRLRLLFIGFDTTISAEQIRHWADQYHVQDIIRITGHRNDVAACISALDLGLVSSLWSETIARAALEIMSCEIPLISTDVGVMPDLLERDALVPVNDIPALADRIQCFIDTPGQRDRLLSHQKMVMADLSEARFLEKTMELYQSLLG